MQYIVFTGDSNSLRQPTRHVSDNNRLIVVPTSSLVSCYCTVAFKLIRQRIWMTVCHIPVTEYICMLSQRCSSFLSSCILHMLRGAFNIDYAAIQRHRRTIASRSVVLACSETSPVVARMASSAVMERGKETRVAYRNIFSRTFVVSVTKRASREEICFNA